MSQNILNTNINMNYYKLKDDMTDIVYQKQYMDAFNITNFDTKTVEKKTEQLYEELKNNIEIQTILDKLI